eukprot:CAMPEP_0119321044 /NCGR_PEP_ID=MMETSP1333-20130426/54256_1 /TAXON_ID=418940 /ORGANISM="Scyphosphaera apsteinii, Strain RCC1455" /LENGTH=163 /DNA_ID=CAMNT_0007327911 /DNA_START=1 /DNA_END=489 /DNA_ORIENTATION=+
MFKHKYPQRLDYLFFCDAHCVRSCAFPTLTRLVTFTCGGDEGARLPYTHLSDHFGVSTTLRIENDFFWRHGQHEVSPPVDPSAVLPHARGGWRRILPVASVLAGALALVWVAVAFVHTKYAERLLGSWFISSARLTGMSSFFWECLLQPPCAQFLLVGSLLIF